MGKEKIFLVLIIILLGFGLRLVNLNQSLWLDETAQAVMSSKSVGEIWLERQADFHPPLFYVMAHYWMQIGHSEIWLRLLPVIFGVISVGLIYLLAGKDKFGLFSAFFLAINPYHIYYSQEFRSYSMLAMLGLLSMLFLKQKKYIWMAITNSLILYTHYSGIFLILAQFIIAPSSIFYFLLSIILYIPWIPRFAEQLQSGVNIDSYLPGWRNVLTLSPIKAIPEIIFKFMAGRINLMPKWVYAIYILFVFGVTGAGIVLNRFERKLLWIWLGIPILASFILSFWIPQTQPFRLLFSLPALVMILAGAATRFPKTFITLVVYISIVGNVLYFT
ncbi:glycosyltransferase family 39 protein, partial [Candidatus Amesbacteria bacterium]|nr:glycosyltransferase family 39 protein [Candidatus Amesbacteria bacterium]